MNGTASNTDGSQVASIGSWPLNLQRRFLLEAGALVEQIQAIVDGTALPATVDFSLKAGDDVVSDRVMAELARRLVVTFESANQTNIVQQPTEPSDHTKLWIQTDPITGVPIGGLKKWDEGTQSWVDSSGSSANYSAPERRRIYKQVAAGASTINIDFADIKTDKYYVSFVFTTEQPNGTWAPPPASYPTAFGYFVTNKTSTQITLAFYGVPVGGLTVDGWIEEITNSNI